MNPNDNDIHDEKLSTLYREAVHEEPPMKLDSAVLLKARKAVEPKNVEKKSWWRRVGWLAPLATVAVAMLTVSLVLQMKREHPEAFSPDKQSAPATLEEAAPSLPALKSEQQGKELKKDELRQRQMQDVMKLKPAAPEPLIENKPAPAAEEVPPPATAPNKLAAPAPARIAEPKQQEIRVRPRMQEPGINRANRAAGTAAPAMTRPAMPPAEPQSEKILYPESWIAKIRELLKQGRKDEAQKEIEAFRAAYPDYELPADLN